MSEPDTSQKIITPANIVTLLRICGVPVFVVMLLGYWPDYIVPDQNAGLIKPLCATVLFIILAATDGLDGYLARSRNEVTNFGKFVDPLADKILTTSALLALVELGVLPSWPVMLILAREFIVAGIRMIAATKNVVIAASWYGKAKTFTQIIAIVLFMIKDSELALIIPSADHWLMYCLSWFFMLLALAFTLISMMDYCVKSQEILGIGTKTNREECSQKDSASFLIKTLGIRNESLACAESLTGGLCSSMICSVPGASQVFRGGFVAYQAQIKESCLLVDSVLIENFGCVSSEVALTMAQGVRLKTQATLALATTGVAGPGPDEEGMPEGCVYIAAVYRGKEKVSRYDFKGSRNEIREQAAFKALELGCELLSDS